MLGKLISFELLKKWKHLRIPVLACMALQVLLLILCKIFAGDVDVNGGSININESSLAAAVLFLVLITSILLYLPIIENIYRFERDLSGKQAVLELMIPAAAWKKLLAKLIASLTTTFLSFLWSGIFTLLFFLVISNFDSGYIDALSKGFRVIADHPGKSLHVFLIALLLSIFIYLLFFFCTAIAKSISHKNKIAIPVAVIVFSVCIFLMVMLSERFPLSWTLPVNVLEGAINYLVWLAVCLAIFGGTSWLVEKKIEH